MTDRTKTPNTGQGDGASHNVIPAPDFITQPPGFPWHELKAALLAQEDVCTAEALERGWGWRLAARIHKLRSSGWPILTHLDGRRCAHYSLQPGWTEEELNQWKR